MWSSHSVSSVVVARWRNPLNDEWRRHRASTYNSVKRQQIRWLTSRRIVSARCDSTVVSSTTAMVHGAENSSEVVDDRGRRRSPAWVGISSTQRRAVAPHDSSSTQRSRARRSKRKGWDGFDTARGCFYTVDGRLNSAENKNGRSQRHWWY
jgi:hypothetical protein